MYYEKEKSETNVLYIVVEISLKGDFGGKKQETFIATLSCTVHKKLSRLSEDSDKRTKSETDFSYRVLSHLTSSRENHRWELVFLNVSKHFHQIFVH